METITKQVQNRGISLTSPRRTLEVFAHRQVVTAFICTFHGSSFEDFKVAIFKRSNQTHSHQ